MSLTHSSGDNLELVSMPLASTNGYTPCTLHIWFRNQSTNDQVCLAVGADGADSERHSVGYRGASGATTAYSASGGSFPGGDSSTGDPTANVWKALTGVFRANNSRSAYFNGGGKTTNTTTLNPSGFNTVIIGRRGNGASPVGGQLAHATIWNVGLTDDEVAALGASRVHPLLIRPEAIVFYSPLHSTIAADLISSASLTTTGTVTSTEEPPILWRPTRRIYVPPLAAPDTDQVLMGLEFGVTFSAVVGRFGLLSAGLEADADVSAQSAAQASIVVGVEADDAGGADAGAFGHVQAASEADATAVATASALAAISAGMDAGEEWAAHAAAAASLAAAAEFGELFLEETQSTQTGAVSAGTQAAAQFLAAAQTIADLTPGVTLEEAVTGLAVAFGQLTQGAQFGGSFAYLIGNPVLAEAGISASAVFEVTAAALGSLADGLSLDAFLRATATRDAALQAGLSLGTAFTAEGGAVTILPPARKILRVSERQRVLRTAGRITGIRVVPRVR